LDKVELSRQSFSLFKTDDRQRRSDQMETTNGTATQKLTGAAAKADRQAKLKVVATEPITSDTLASLTPEPATAEPETAEPAAVTDLATLQAMRKALDAQFRAVKAATKQPPATTKTLATVVAKQTAQPKKWPAVGIAEFVEQRERQNQDRGEALDQVLAQYKSIVLGILDMRDAGEPVRDATDRWLAENAPIVMAQVESMHNIMLSRSAALRERLGGEEPAEAEADAE